MLYTVPSRFCLLFSGILYSLQMKVDFYFVNGGDFPYQPQLAVGADSLCTYEVFKLELKADSELAM